MISLTFPTEKKMENQKEAANSEELSTTWARKTSKNEESILSFFYSYGFVEGLKDCTMSVDSSVRLSICSPVRLADVCYL
jgi:hypothetical protein